MYVVVAKVTLKQTNILHFANGVIGCGSKKENNDNEFVHCM